MNFQSKFHGIVIAGVIACTFLLAAFAGRIFAADADAPPDGPERQVFLAVDYPGIVVGQGDDITMDVILKNKGRRGENVRIWVAEKPPAWEATIKSYNFGITGAFVPAEGEKSLSLKIEPDDDVQPGEYSVRIDAKTDDEAINMQQLIRIQIRKKEITAKPAKLVLTTSYPEIKGPSDGTFEFSVEVKSELDEETMVDLFAQGPQGWDINIKPAYESKYISSLRLKANQSQTIAVEVKPAYSAAAGEFPVLVRVSSGEFSAESKLSVILTGTYNLEMGTASGLLSLEAHQGKPSVLSFYIRNTGSAANSNIELISFKPENWKVEFSPERVEVIEPGELAQVEMTITPNENALIGDYSLDVKAQGEKASPSLKFRVSVKAAALWGWVGIAVIVLVILGLFALFKVFGRR